MLTSPPMRALKQFQRFLILATAALCAYAQADEQINQPTQTNSASELDLGLTFLQTPYAFNQDGISLTGLTLQFEESTWLTTPSTSDQPPLSLEEQAQQLVSNALELVGTPYKRGGTNAASGFDCSGFVQSIFAETVSYDLPRVAREQASVTLQIPKTELQPGDLVFFNTMRRGFSHVGIYIGNDRFVHSPRSGASVRIDSMHSAYWSKRFNGARRVPLAAS